MIMDNDILSEHLTEITQDDEGWLYFELVAILSTSEIDYLILR